MTLHYPAPPAKRRRQLPGTHPGFIVMKKPTRESKLTVLPSVNTNDFLRSRMADSTQ